MLESIAPEPKETLDDVVRRGPVGALWLCGIAVAFVIAIWLAFYVFAFLARGIVR